MGKTFKNLLLQNLACLMAESLHISSGTGELPKLLYNGRTLTFDLFTLRSILLPYVFVWEKVFRISNNFSSGAPGPILLKFHMEPP